MKFTATLCRRNLIFHWKKLWGGKRGQFSDCPVVIPSVLKEKGVEIIDPNVKPPLPVWKPPVDDPRFYKHPPNEELKNYNEEPAFICEPHSCIYQGINQAACLAKAQVIQGFPSSLEKFKGIVDIPDQNLLLQRYIMQSQYWNTTMEKLPKRIDPRKPGWKFKTEYGIPAKLQGAILIRNMLNLCRSQVVSYPSLTERRHIYKPWLNSSYYYKGKPIVVRGLGEWLITSNKPVSCFADEDMVDASVAYTLPDIYPISPTIDFLQLHNYTIQHDLGMKAGWSHSHPHTLFQVDVNHWKTEQKLARDMLFCLGYALAQAHHRFGNVTALPEPICIQSVSLNHQSLNFVFFQLNTLAFDSDNGVKNLVWVDGGNNLFTKILGLPYMPKALRKTRLEDFDPAAFQKLLAVYLNGVSEA